MTHVNSQWVWAGVSDAEDTKSSVDQADVSHWTRLHDVAY